MRASWTWVIDYLLCPACSAPLRMLSLSADERDGILAHTSGSCVEEYPVIEGIPRLLVGDARARLFASRRAWFDDGPGRDRFASWRSSSRHADATVVARFDREWNAFSRVGTAEQERLFELYFDLVPPESLGHGHVVLDAGCGAGRWAYQAQRHGARVIAIDLGLSVEVASRNTLATGRVACVQADVQSLPIRSGALDVAYSLGVLHHVERTADAVGELARVTRPGGSCLLYVYYALDSRSSLYRLLFRAVDAVRRRTAALPQPLLAPFSALVAATVYFPLARTSLALGRVGMRRLASRLPLSFYATLSFQTMRNDSLDRFGTPLEKRFTREQVGRLLERAGFEDVQISPHPPFWHASARRSVGGSPSASLDARAG